MSNRAGFCVGLVACLTWILAITAVGLADEPVEIARGAAPRNPQQPQLAVDGKRTIHLVYGVGNVVKYCQSTGNYESFSDPVELSFGRAMSLGMRRGPRIAVDETAICITAIAGQQGKGRDGDVWAMRSSDRGESWSEPLRVNDVPDSAREGLHAMAGGPNGRMCCVWLDLRNKVTEIVASVSSDSGATWGKNVLVYKSPSGSVCECCHPFVAFDDRGTIYVQWRNSLLGNRDIYVASSADGGDSFGEAIKLGEGSWPIAACPMDGGALAVAGDQVYSTWRRDKSVFVSGLSPTAEQWLGEGEQPWIAATKAGPYIVWLARRDREGYLLSPGNENPVEFASNASDPVVAAPSNAAGPVCLAWESRDGSQNVIRFRVLNK